MTRDTIASLTAQRDDLQRQVAQLRQSNVALLQSAEGEDPFADLVKRAHQYADDNGLCSEFDAAMEALGLPARPSVYVVTVQIQVKTSSYLTAGQAVAGLLESARTTEFPLEEGYMSREVGEFQGGLYSGANIQGSGTWWSIDTVDEN